MVSFMHTNSICDPLSEDPAHHAFYENRDKIGIGYQCVPNEMHHGHGTQHFEETQSFNFVTVNPNVSVHYCENLH